MTNSLISADKHIAYQIKNSMQSFRGLRRSMQWRKKKVKRNLHIQVTKSEWSVTEKKKKKEKKYVSQTKLYYKEMTTHRKLSSIKQLLMFV